MKTIVLLIMFFFVLSCSTPGRVCGGAGGKRCVEVSKISTVNKIS